MRGIVAAVKRKVPQQCQTRQCRSSGCTVSMSGAPDSRVIVDMDCTALAIPAGTVRCDYLFIGETVDNVWVTPIELKSGKINGGDVVNQLQGGADFAESLPVGEPVRFLPVLAHGKGVHRKQRQSLRERHVTFRGGKYQVTLIRCRQPIADVL